MRARREAVRETWLTKGVAGIKCLFFIGGGEPLPDEPDTIVLACPDGYDELPEKVLAFFRYCIDQLHFDWLFKCDDDTYLVQQRLQELLALDVELVGSPHLDARGSPSGGAGYLLSRRIVGLLVNSQELPSTGAEDVILGEAALGLGATYRSTSRLRSTNDCYPSRDNDIITSHYCSPTRLRIIHARLYEVPRIIYVRHSLWADHLSLYSTGRYSRNTANCYGIWEGISDGYIVLNWEEWGRELLIPIGDDHYRCVPFPDVSLIKPQAAPFKDSGGGANAGTHAVFLTTSKYGLPHLDRFLELNSGVPIHVVCTEIAEEGEARAMAWRNCDILIRNWWFERGQYLIFEYAAFIEWDVLFDNTLDTVFPDANDYYCPNLKRIGMPWSWFSNISVLPEALQPFAVGTPPMAVLRISRRCLAAMFSHPAAGEAYQRDIQAELRFPTLAAACGYEPTECPETLRNVTCWNASVGFGPSVWHAVKEGQNEYLRLPETLKMQLFGEGRP